MNLRDIPYTPIPTFPPKYANWDMRLLSVAERRSLHI